MKKNADNKFSVEKIEKTVRALDAACMVLLGMLCGGICTLMFGYFTAADIKQLKTMPLEPIHVFICLAAWLIACVVVFAIRRKEQQVDEEMEETVRSLQLPDIQEDEMELVQWAKDEIDGDLWAKKTKKYWIARHFGPLLVSCCCVSILFCGVFFSLSPVTSILPGIIFGTLTIFVFYFIASIIFKESSKKPDWSEEKLQRGLEIKEALQMLL